MPTTIGPELMPCPAPLTSVHPLESTVDRPLALASVEDDCQAYSFRHSSWAPTRARVWAALQALSPSPTVKYERLDRFASCGRRAWIMQHTAEPARFKFVIDSCHDRFCVPCGNHRATVIAENLARRLGPGPYRFLTLTLRSANSPLSDQLDRLFNSFRKLRQRAFWRERVAGGAAFFEVTWLPDTLHWHPHLHVIIAGTFLPHAMLKAAWLDITGDSNIVDIRFIRTRETVIHYCSKYATKPLHPSVVRHADTLRNAIHALSGRKLVNPFGDWAKWALLKEPSDGHWELYCYVDAACRAFHCDLHSARQFENAWSLFATGQGPAIFALDQPPTDPDT